MQKIDYGSAAVRAIFSRSFQFPDLYIFQQIHKGSKRRRMDPPIYRFVSKPIQVTTLEKKRKSLEQGAGGSPIGTAKKMDVDQATLDAMQKTQLRLINENVELAKQVKSLQMIVESLSKKPDTPAWK